MSGEGERFKRAGFSIPKPLIKIDGKPIIEHVCNLFPGENKFTFICNSRHLAETDMRNILLQIRPSSRIVEIPNHKKGPVFAVSQIFDLIEDEEEVIVNYCDFGTYWDYEDFLRHTRNRKADGAIPSYKGFHPHMLGSTNYAFIRDNQQWMLEIKEKEPFTENRMQEYASNGTYYFKRGAYVKKYFNDLILGDYNLNGEYYVSLVFNLMKTDGLSISIFEIQHMLQWGTPEDVSEYMKWSGYFRKVIEPQPSFESLDNTITLIPLAGKGSRFSAKGYKNPKPLLIVSGKPMIVQATNSLPKSEFYSFVVLEEHVQNFGVDKLLKGEYANSSITVLNEVTKGQSITCSLGLKGYNRNLSLIISATDNGILFNRGKLIHLIESENADAIIFTFRNHQSSKQNPQMYGWVGLTEGSDFDVKNVSVKVPISDSPFYDHAIVGTFWFKNIELFDKALNIQLEKQITVNNEYYVDSLMGILVGQGYRIKVLEVDHYICWGTPEDYETFNYWQSFFQKCAWHPYQINLDKTMNHARYKEIISIITNKHKQKF